MNIFSRNLKQLREEKKMSLQELSDTINNKYGINTTKGMISRWENDKSEAGIQYVIKLADFFGVTLDYIIGVEEKQTVSEFDKLPENIRIAARGINELPLDKQEIALQMIAYLLKKGDEPSNI